MEIQALVQHILDMCGAMTVMLGTPPRYCYVGAKPWRLLKARYGAPIRLGGMRVHPRLDLDEWTVLCTVEAQS